jgi:hypothetical protein
MSLDCRDRIEIVMCDVRDCEIESPKEDGYADLEIECHEATSLAKESFRRTS